MPCDKILVFLYISYKSGKPNWLTLKKENEGKNTPANRKNVITVSKHGQLRTFLNLEHHHLTPSFCKRTD